MYLASAKLRLKITPPLTIGLLAVPLFLSLSTAWCGIWERPWERRHPVGGPQAPCLRLSSSRLSSKSPGIPEATLLRLIRAEDERRYDEDLAELFSADDPQIRRCAVLAAGRIGDDRAVPALIKLLQEDRDVEVRQMAAFALGQIASPAGADALLAVLRDSTASSSERKKSAGRMPAARPQDAGAQRRAPSAFVSVARPSGRAESQEAGRRTQVAVARSPGRAVNLNQSPRYDLGARAVEALGKIAAALPEAEKSRKRVCGEAILDTLRFEDQRRPAADRLTVLLGLTAALRAKPDGAGPIIARFLSSSDARVRADAANALARLRLKDGADKLRDLLVKDSDPIVRANAARALGGAEDKQSFDALLDRALHDDDLRVRVSSIRALGSLKENRATGSLLVRGRALLASYKRTLIRSRRKGIERNELLEVVAAIGRTARETNNAQAIRWLRDLRTVTMLTAPEVEIALASVSPNAYLDEDKTKMLFDAFPEDDGWRRLSSLMQGLRELANVGLGTDERRRKAEDAISHAVCLTLKEGGCPTYEQGVPYGLMAYAAFKPVDLDQRLREQFELQYYSWGILPAPKGIYAVPDEHMGYTMPKDVIIRSTAAELLGSLPPSVENTKALARALPIAFYDEMNDAALAILDALAKQKSEEANDAIKTALDSSDHLIRRKAVSLLKANGAGDFSDRIGTVKTRNTEADYRRAISRIGKEVTTTVETTKGAFTIEFLPEDAPLTVDNFIQLARKGFFNGQTIPRVVPNFVIQAGDPRGDTNGGPGYQIRCEINEVPYERGAVGMALSGKDTGGSQWFVTHSPQPHLDGGYTVFGRVIKGMEVVDAIARGDIIRGVSVDER